MECNTLRPGLLVSLKTSIKGGVKYRKHVIEKPHTVETGAERAKWETVRTITDPTEHDRAVKTRSKIRNTISGVCAQSAFGLLCPESKVADLEAAIVKARESEDEFNESANNTKVNLFVITGRIEPNDAEAIRAINSEVADLIETMSNGLKKLDVKVVREAADKARSIATMLSESSAERVNEAISAARSAARKLVKAGEAAAVAIDYEALRSLSEARTAFLDVNEKPIEVVAPEAEAHAIDLETETAPGHSNIGSELPDLELARGE